MKKVIIFLILCVSVFAGCTSKYDQTANTEAENESIEENNEVEGNATDVLTLRWLVPDIIHVNDETLKELNLLLKEDGYDFALEIYTLDNIEYVSELENYLNEGGSADIACVGYSTIDSYRLIKNGLFISLDTYLTSPPGETIKALYAESLWDSVKVKQSIYTIPSGVLTNSAIKIVFNTDIITPDMLGEFDGTIGCLWNMIQTREFTHEDLSVTIQSDIYDLENFLQTDNVYGMLLSYVDRHAYSPLDYEEYINTLQAYHKMYMAGFLTDYSANTYIPLEETISKFNSGDFGIHILSEDIDKANLPDNVEVYETPIYITSRLNASTGVLSQSENQTEALQLLNLVYTDPRYANLLIYGREDIEYYLEGGKPVALIAEGEDEIDINMKGFVHSLAFGIYESAIPSWDDPSYIINDRTEDKKKFYEENVENSPFIGFNFDTTNYEQQVLEIEEAMNSYLGIWQEEDLDAALVDARNHLKEIGIDEVLEELNRQLEDFLSE